MAKLGGPVRSLIQLFMPYALSIGGKVYNLSSDMVMQQDCAIGTGVAFGPASVVTSGSISPTDVVTRNPSSIIKGTKFAASNTLITLGPTIADKLSFTTKELTVSMWVSGSTFSTTSPGLKKSYKLQSSGTQGVQFVIGATSPTPTATDYAVAIMSEKPSPSAANPINIVASSRKTAGLNASQLAASTIADFSGRTSDVLNPAGIPAPLNIAENCWHHLVYVQRAAENQEELKFVDWFGSNTSPLQGISSTGKEGLCQFWVDGELLYESPSHGPYPQGFSQYFYEQGVESLTSAASTDITYPGSLVLKRTLRQSDSQAFLSGSNANGDAIAQLAIWKRTLSAEEIKSIYLGVQNGVYTKQLSSVSSAPKRLLNRSADVSIPLLNHGFQDSVGTQRVAPFSDKKQDEDIISRKIYQQFHSYTPLTDNITEVVLSDGTTGNTQQLIRSYIDSNDVSTAISDEDLMMPSGSAIIKISVTNNDRFTIAGRYQAGSTPATDLFTEYTKAGADNSSAIGTGFLYYSPKLKKWNEKRADATSSRTTTIGLLHNGYTQASASNFVKQINQLTSGESAAVHSSEFVASNDILSQFSWSPQFGYFVSHIEHLRQAGYERIGWPTSFFGAPNAPKYHAFDHETIKLSDYINRPFLLKRIELKIPVRSVRRFGANPREFTQDISWPSPTSTPPGLLFPISSNKWENQITNKKDIDNYVFFVYRQRRVSRDRDSVEDRNTSKRYLIASASVCYVNSASFGGAWKDGFYDPRLSGGWPVNPDTRAILSSSLARPSDTIDFLGSSLTLISGTNCILHSPQCIFEWSIERFIQPSPGTPTSIDAEIPSTLNLKMFPMTVPASSASPSLIPMTCSNFFSTPASFMLRDAGSTTLTGCLAYVASGTRNNLTANVPAAVVSLVSNAWPGGKRPALFDAHQSLPLSANYDTTTKNIFPVLMKGIVDTIVWHLPALSAIARPAIGSLAYALGVDSVVTWKPVRGFAQCHGFSNYPGSSGGNLSTKHLFAQTPIDPQSILESSVHGDIQTNFYGRVTNSTPGQPNNWTVSNASVYMGHFGWRFISSFQLSNLSESQAYSPEILEPEDELILGLDAGTFGPPDLDVDDLIISGGTPNTSTEGLGDTGLQRLFKNAYLKEDYRYTLADSRLHISTGDAELILVGDFLEDQSPRLPSRSTPFGDGISSIIGNDPITDKSFLFNLDLLSGSRYTRVFTGSEGPSGLLEGNTNPDAARRFFRDAGARRSN